MEDLSDKEYNGYSIGQMPAPGKYVSFIREEIIKHGATIDQTVEIFRILCARMQDPPLRASPGDFFVFRDAVSQAETRRGDKKYD